MQYLCSGSGTGIADLDNLLVLALQSRVLLTQLANGEDLTLVAVLAVSWVYNDLLTPDTVILCSEVELVDELLLKEGGITASLI